MVAAYSKVRLIYGILRGGLLEHLSALEPQRLYGVALCHAGTTTASRFLLRLCNLRLVPHLAARELYFIRLGFENSYHHSPVLPSIAELSSYEESSPSYYRDIAYARVAATALHPVWAKAHL